MGVPKSNPGFNLGVRNEDGQKARGTVKVYCGQPVERHRISEGGPEKGGGAREHGCAYPWYWLGVTGVGGKGNICLWPT